MGLDVKEVRLKGVKIKEQSLEVLDWALTRENAEKRKCRQMIIVQYF